MVLCGNQEKRDKIYLQVRLEQRFNNNNEKRENQGDTNGNESGSLEPEVIWVKGGLSSEHENA